MSSSPRTMQTGAQTLDRGLHLLEVVAQAAAPVTVSEAAAAVGVHRTVAHRLIATLTARGYLHREADGGYRLGSTCVALASAGPDLRAVLRPLLEDLAGQTNESIGLAVLSGRDMVFLDGIESPQSLRVAVQAGHRAPAYATSVGKAWLAGLSAERLHALYPDDESLPPNTASARPPRAELERTLAAVRRRGYAFATNENLNDVGVGSFGALVRTPSGEPAAAVSVAMPLARLTPAAKQFAISALTRTAAAMNGLMS